MSAMLTADWYPIDKDSYFRKFEIYSMNWVDEVNLDHVIIASSPFGGPLAVRRNTKKLIKVNVTSKPTLLIYSAAGNLMSSIVWNKSPLIHVGWSVSEELLCFTEDGYVLTYDMNGSYLHTFSMGPEAKNTRVIEAKVFHVKGVTGLVILTSIYRFFRVNNIKEPKARMLPEIPGLTAAPSSWTVLSEDGNTQVIVAREKKLFVLDQRKHHASLTEIDLADKMDSLIVEMAVSNDYKHIAFFTDKGTVWLGSTDRFRKYCEVEATQISSPRQFAWCGSEGVVCHWDGELLLVSQSGDTLTYPCDLPVHLCPEIDGVRVISANSHEMLQKVPTVVQRILLINSVDPGSYLLEASRQFQETLQERAFPALMTLLHRQAKSHRADEYIRLVKDRLPAAVNACTEAASYEFQHKNQDLLIRAAWFGKSFTPGLDPERYVNTCRILRVLNDIRDPKVALPITNVQLLKMGIKGLLEKLTRRGHYYLAIQICKHLKLTPAVGSSLILAEWAFYKVSQTKQDREKVAKEIANKLGRTPGVSYKDIAEKALQCGHTQLAIKLMDYEPRVREQVPLLKKMGQDVPTLVKALDSGDTDLIYDVLFHMRSKLQMGDFQMKIRNYPLAQALYIKYCRSQDPEILKSIYSQEDDHNALAACTIRESYVQKDLEKGESFEGLLRGAAEKYKTAKNDFGASVCDEQLRIIRHQQTLDKTLKQKCEGKLLSTSLHDTLRYLLVVNEIKWADKLRAEFKVTDRRYWWLRISVLAEQSEWIELEKLSKAKKSPIGYEPFVDVCLEHKNLSEAKKYFLKVKEEVREKYQAKIMELEKVLN